MYKATEREWHELLDRLHILQLMHQASILEASAIESDAEIKAKAEAIALAIGELYQAVGEKWGDAIEITP